MLLLPLEQLWKCARAKTGEAIKRLIGLQPRTARVIRDDQEIDIPIAEVQIGDHLHVRPGGKIPVDAKIIEGASPIDESMLTGEPLPVVKSQDDEVIGGTINKFRYVHLSRHASGKRHRLSPDYCVGETSAKFQT